MTYAQIAINCVKLLFNILYMNKTIDKCEMPDDVKDLKYGITKYRHLKRDWHYCPMCKAKAVNKDMRRCDACGRRLLFDFDDAAQFEERYEAYHRWTTTVFGLTGYFHSDYWQGNFNQMIRHYD
jgi:rubredoxin